MATMFILIEAQHECKGLGAGLKISMKSLPCGTYNTMLCVCTVTGTTCTFVYREEKICASVASKWTTISLELCSFLLNFLMFYQAFHVNLSFKMWYVCCWRALRLLAIRTNMV